MRKSGVAKQGESNIFCCFLCVVFFFFFMLSAILTRQICDISCLVQHFYRMLPTDCHTEYNEKYILPHFTSVQITTQNCCS